MEAIKGGHRPERSGKAIEGHSLVRRTEGNFQISQDRPHRHRILPLLLSALCLLPAAARAGERIREESKALLVVEYGLDSLERRYYRPRFRFDFPVSRHAGLFAEVQYHSLMNGRLQGAIDYWVNAGARRRLGPGFNLELRLNHFCRHSAARETPYVWNLNELLGRAVLERDGFTLVLGAGPFVGGSAGYRSLATAGGQWRGVLIPELSLEAEFKLVDFRRLYHEAGFSLALSPNLELFFRNARRYEMDAASFIGARLRSGANHDSFLESLKVLVGASPFDERLKLEVEGGFKMEFFRRPERRIALDVGFEAPILNGDSFFAQFWPWKMLYDIGLDYELRVARSLFAAWRVRYRLDLPVDDDRPFLASLFAGLALRNQPDFDALDSGLRYEVTAGCDFKHGLEAQGRLGLQVWQGRAVKLAAEARVEARGDRLRLDLRLLAAGGRAVEWRPYVGWKKDICREPQKELPGKFLLGLGFFKTF